MRKLILPLLAFLALSFLLPSCSEKFDVAAPYKSITIVYGLLDRGDTAHYVRVEKAFLDDKVSALVMSQVPDSSFFNNINVRIQRMTQSGTRMDTTHLTRVDLNAEGYPKESGAFFNSPNYAYKFKGTLDPAFIYRIIVTNKSTGEVDSADAPVIDNRAYTALTLYSIDDTTHNSEIDFTSTNPNTKNDIKAIYNAGSYHYGDFLTPAAVAQGFIRFHWIDSNTASGTAVARFYDYDLGFIELPNSNSSYFQYSVKNVSMYNALKTGMGTAPVNVSRLIDRCELIVYLGSSDFYTYIKVSQQAGTGLTGSEIQPTYTNVKGKNVLGLFASRIRRSGYITISPNTVNALETLDLMRDEHITGTVYH